MSAGPYGPHHPVLAAEVMDLLVVDRGGGYLDATAGGGGHTRELLKRLDAGGRVAALDRDPRAVEELRRRFSTDARVSVAKADFRDLAEVHEVLRIAPLAGVLFDFGVSSDMLDSAERGFSHRHDGPLDMRMDTEAPLTAADVVNTYGESELARVFREYGELRGARKLARAVIAARPLATTGELAGLVRGFSRGAEEAKTLARVFQAIRIEVNDELGAIREALPAAFGLLAVGGRMVTLAYHSLEDRIVKRFFRERCGQAGFPRGPVPPVQQAEPPVMRLLLRGAKQAGGEEIELNPRARSARLRAAERIR